MTASTSYFPRNPKFTDSFERDLTNDDVVHIGRDEPSLLKPAFSAIAAAFAAVVRTVHFLRASAQRPAMRIQAS